MTSLGERRNSRRLILVAAYSKLVVGQPIQQLYGGSALEGDAHTGRG